MPIPAFDSNSVLPPHMGDPREIGQLSPYPCTSLELCERFATSLERRRMLDGFLRFRERLGQFALSTGFQWLDGSFLEDIEAIEARAPGDLDIVTFYTPTTIDLNTRLRAGFPEFWDRNLSKRDFGLDHFPVDMGHNPFLTVEMARYWSSLFSHRRDRVWKGMLRIDLNTPLEDIKAREHLTKLV